MKRATKIAAGWLAAGLGIFGLTRLSVTERVVPSAYSAFEDTVTYGDGRIVYKVPVTLDTTDNGDIIYVPDVSLLPAGAQYVVRMKPSKDSALVITYDTAAASPTDSATVEAIYAAWSLGTPLAYVIEVPGEPVPPPTGWWLPNPDSVNTAIYIDYQEYASSEEYREDSWSDSWNLTYQFIDTDTVAPGLGFTQSMRYDWFYADSLSGVTDAITVGVGKNIPNYNVAPYVREVWWEIYFKTSDNFSSCSPCATACTPCDHKTIFLQTSASTGYNRWAWHFWGTHGDGSPYGRTVGLYTPRNLRFDAGWTAPNYWSYYDDTGYYSSGYGLTKWGQTQGWTTDSCTVHRNDDPFPSYYCRWRDGWDNKEYPSYTYWQNYGQMRDQEDYVLRGGGWHVARGYMKASDQGQTNGRMAFWVDSILVIDSKELQDRFNWPEWEDYYWDSAGTTFPADSTVPYSVSSPVSSNRVYPKAILIGQNKDHGGGWYKEFSQTLPASWTESWWIQYVQVYTEDPGWPLWPDLCPRNAGSC